MQDFGGKVVAITGAASGIGGALADVGREATAFADEFDKLARITPGDAARQIIRAVERYRRRASIGPDVKVFDLVSRLPAGPYQRLLIAAGRRRT